MGPRTAQRTQLLKNFCAFGVRFSVRDLTTIIFHTDSCFYLTQKSQKFAEMGPRTAQRTQLLKNFCEFLRFLREILRVRFSV